MKLTDINIRDPYILCSGDWYYMYGTRAETCWGAAEGFDCFKSKDLENWEGPFEIFHKPEDFWADNWNCIDGMLYQEKGKIYLIFSHSFEDVPDGDMCMVELEENLSCIKGKIITLFSAKDAGWAVPVPFAKAEFGMDGDVYFTDGPAVYRQQNGKLLILWSSWGEKVIPLVRQFLIPEK